MKLRSFFRCILAFLLLCNAVSAYSKPKKKVYMTYVLHGNMNYDRYVRPVIWAEFPVIYNNLLDFMDEHPDFKGQVQFSGQTFGSLLQASPYVIEHAKAIHDRGQLNFTGTFYSEPVNVNMDGETNFRCAWLGTKIIEDYIGETDGFYLQERAYHPQLPWILNNADVSWTPVITNDDSFAPFRLRGLDGSVSVCVPITREKILERIRQAPKNALISIEEDYEIPQTFSNAYDMIDEFNKAQDEIRVEWITVKEYIRKFGLGEEKFVDHSAKADVKEHGTYSRWTADPLDIVVQDYTNKAMNLFRLANAMDAICRARYGVAMDLPLSESGITMIEDPLAWNIERADLYPEHEKYLARDGVTTVLAKAEHLLLWAVNSDSKGWFPLYEKRRERINALENSANLSEYVIDKALDYIGSGIRAKDYDKYYILLNMEAARKGQFEIETGRPCELFDLSSGQKLRSHAVFNGSSCKVVAETDLPEYGYMIVGSRAAGPSRTEWKPGSEISTQSMKLSAEGGRLSLESRGRKIEIRLDTFQLKALAHMDRGEGDGQWRSARQYGPVRISVCEDGLYPRLKIESQPDWLIHLQQVYTLMDDRLVCEMRFDFPHPTVVRKKGPEGPVHNFSPDGLNLLISDGVPATVGYDIPFGISEFDKPGVHHFCLLTSCFLQGRSGGFMVCPTTGEQAFSVDSDKGEVTLYLGASTTSGPIREMGLDIVSPTVVQHDREWYAEPFHGIYDHEFVLYPYEGTWQAAHLPKVMREVSQDVYVRQICPTSGNGAYKGAFLKGIPVNADVTGVFYEKDGLKVRMNEREGAGSETMAPFAIKMMKID